MCTPFKTPKHQIRNVNQGKGATNQRTNFALVPFERCTSVDLILRMTHKKMRQAFYNERKIRSIRNDEMESLRRKVAQPIILR